MPQTTFRCANQRHPLAAAIALTATVLTLACTSTPPAAPAPAPVSPDTWAVVNGQAITKTQVDKAYGRTRDTSQVVSDEDALVAKLSVLNDLIVQEILLEKARTLKIEVPQTDVDAAFADAKKNIPDEAFQQELTRRNLTPADMQDGLRRELLSEKVVSQEVGAKITVSDQEVTDFFTANRAQFNLTEEAYRIAQIAITPVRDAQIANQTGDDATTPQAAAQKVQMLMERLKAGASFADLAVGYSEDPESAPRGGDLGLVPVSKLMQAPPALRNAVLKKEPGSVNVATIGGGYTLVLVVGHELAGQRDLSTPGVKDQVTQGLHGRKEQLLRAAYLTAVRTDAQVVNYLARRIVESQGKVPPTLAPGAPK